jgi:hypothetical protein
VKLIALVVAGVLAAQGGADRGLATPDGGVPLATTDAPVLEVVSALVTSPDDRSTMPVFGGCWLDEQRCIGLGQRERELRERAELAEKNEKAAGANSPVLALVFGGGVVLGVGVTLLVVFATGAKK